MTNELMITIDDTIDSDLTAYPNLVYGSDDQLKAAQSIARLVEAKCKLQDTLVKEEEAKHRAILDRERAEAEAILKQKQARNETLRTGVEAGKVIVGSGMTLLLAKWVVEIEKTGSVTSKIYGLIPKLTKFM